MTIYSSIKTNHIYQLRVSETRPNVHISIVKICYAVCNGCFTYQIISLNILSLLYVGILDQYQSIHYRSRRISTYREVPIWDLLCLPFHQFFPLSKVIAYTDAQPYLPINIANHQDQLEKKLKFEICSRLFKNLGYILVFMNWKVSFECFTFGIAYYCRQLHFRWSYGSVIVSIMINNRFCSHNYASPIRFWYRYK